MTARSMVWIEGTDGGWSCSNCQWKIPVPTFLSEKEARDAYDRLAAAKFAEHNCEECSLVPEQSATSTVADRARILVMRGYTPKVAVEIVLYELEFEHRNDPGFMAKARVEAEEFLHRIRKGLI
jgi:Zn-finger protein